MAERDEFDEMAERLLPCIDNAFHRTCNVGMQGHGHNCPALYRLAVAAELRARMQRDVELRTLRDWWQDKAENYRSELADLRAELQARDDQITLLLKTNDDHVIEIERLRAAMEGK